MGARPDQTEAKTTPILNSQTRKNRAHAGRSNGASKFLNRTGEIERKREQAGWTGTKTKEGRRWARERRKKRWGGREGEPWAQENPDESASPPVACTVTFLGLARLGLGHGPTCQPLACSQRWLASSQQGRGFVWLLI
nr:unnamed protein product [Digitaria exilis]